MRHTFNEIVLKFRTPELKAWIAGDKSLTLPFIELDSMILNQNAYHFGEIFTIDHFWRQSGWLGFRFFALGAWEPEVRRYEKGRRMIERMTDASRLATLRRVRCADPRELKGKGEPDVFLYKSSGEMMFLEVKKGADKIDEYQLRCLSQVRQVLGCAAEIVYLCEEGRLYRPKTYEYDLQLDPVPN